MRKKRLFLFVMCAHAATRGGSLPVVVLLFSSRVFKLHEVMREDVKGLENNARNLMECCRFVEIKRM